MAIGRNGKVYKPDQRIIDLCWQYDVQARWDDVDIGYDVLDRHNCVIATLPPECTEDYCLEVLRNLDETRDRFEDAE